MISVHILTEGFRTMNSRALLYPMLRYRAALKDRGITVTVFHELGEGLRDCKVLIIDSKFYKNDWGDGPELVLDELARFTDDVDSFLWFDTTDSTGTLQTRVLPYVDGYYKNQVLRDRDAYSRPMYGERPFTDYYHREYGIDDHDPVRHRPIEDNRELDKLRISWNFGLADYSPSLPAVKRIFERLPYWCFERLPHDLYLGNVGWTNPETYRENDVAGRFSVDYDRETIKHQRKQMADLVSKWADTSFVSRREFWTELRDSKLVVSPFGWGEPCFRDFEGFRSGCLLVKPAMDHLETWPPFYEDGETMIAVDWSLEDLEDTIEDCLDNYGDLRTIAACAQTRYRNYLVGDSARRRFVDRFERLLGDVI